MLLTKIGAYPKAEFIDKKEIANNKSNLTRNSLQLLKLLNSKSAKVLNACAKKDLPFVP